MVVQMMAVGEDTGALDAMLEKIAEFYDQEVSATSAALTSLIEPLMIAILGFQSILMGLIAELLMRTYHESQGKPTYTIRKTVNLQPVEKEEEPLF